MRYQPFSLASASGWSLKAFQLYGLLVLPLRVISLIMEILMRHETCVSVKLAAVLAAMAGLALSVF
jgi:hypothetical protein